MKQKLYRAGTVHKVTDVKPITLRQWHIRLRGKYALESEMLPELADIAPAFGGKPTAEMKQAAEEVTEAQRQGWRLYTFNDIVRVLIIHRLTLLGFTVERAVMIANECNVDGALEWPDRSATCSIEDVIEGRVMPKGGTKPRPVEKDQFTVSFLPAEDLLNRAEGLADEHERDLLRQMHVGQATNTYSGRTGVGSLAWAFRTEPSISEPGLLSRDMGVVINVSAYAREVKRRLDELDTK